MTWYWMWWDDMILAGWGGVTLHDNGWIDMILDEIRRYDIGLDEMSWF